VHYALASPNWRWSDVRQRTTLELANPASESRGDHIEMTDTKSRRRSIDRAPLGSASSIRVVTAVAFETVKLARRNGAAPPSSGGDHDIQPLLEGATS